MRFVYPETILADSRDETLLLNIQRRKVKKLFLEMLTSYILYDRNSKYITQKVLSQSDFQLTLQKPAAQFNSEAFFQSEPCYTIPSFFHLH